MTTFRAALDEGADQGVMGQEFSVRDDASVSAAPGKPGAGPSSRFPDGWTAAGAALLFGLLYLRTLCPTTYVGDSGEIATAIVTGGITHPPGYPIFCLLGRVALWAVPFGEPAFRIGCVTALSAALAVAVLYLLAREAGASPGPAFTAAGLYGAGFTFWNQSTRVEVYSLHVLFCVTALLGALRYRRTGKPADLALGMLAGSLGMGHHLTIALLAPGAAILCGARMWRDPGLGKRLCLLLALAPVGMAFYGLLVVWSRAEPLHNWGRPSTPQFLLNHVTATIYHNVFKRPDLAHLEQYLPEVWRKLTDNFPYGTVGLPVLGMGLLAFRRPAVLAGLLVAAAGVVAYNSWYRIADLAPYFLSVWAVTAVLLALGLELLYGWFRERVGRPVIPFALGLLLIGVPLFKNWRSCDLSQATWMREFARQKLECAEPNSIMVTQWDPDTFPLWYVQDVLGVRPDVVIVDRSLVRVAYWNLDKDPSAWYLHLLRKRGLRVDTQAPRGLGSRILMGNDGLLFRLALLNATDRPWCMTFGHTDRPVGQDQQLFLRWMATTLQPVPQGLVIRLNPPNRRVSLPQVLARNDELWSRIRVPDFAAIRLDEDLAPDYVVNHYACMLMNYGGLHETSGHLEFARSLYQQAAELAPAYTPAARAFQAVEQRLAKGNNPAPAIPPPHQAPPGQVRQ